MPINTELPNTAEIAEINGAVEAPVGPLAVELTPIRVRRRRSRLHRHALVQRDARRSPGLVLPHRGHGTADGHIAHADPVADGIVLAAANRTTTGSTLEAGGGARLVSVG